MLFSLDVRFLGRKGPTNVLNSLGVTYRLKSSAVTNNASILFNSSSSIKQTCDVLSECVEQMKYLFLMDVLP